MRLSVASSSCVDCQCSPWPEGAGIECYIQTSVGGQGVLELLERNYTLIVYPSQRMINAADHSDINVCVQRRV